MGPKIAKDIKKTSPKSNSSPNLSSAKLAQKAAGYLLASANASKKEADKKGKK
jgi:hypothetical protein